MQIIKQIHLYTKGSRQLGGGGKGPAIKGKKLLKFPKKSLIYIL